MPNRSLTLTDAGYRFGFNGKEKDSDGEWGNSTHYDYGARIYDPNIGRWLSRDPLEYNFPWITPYAYANNNPVVLVDPDGESPISIFAKAVAKLGLKKTAKEFIQKQIQKQLKKYLGKKPRKWAKQLVEDAFTFVDHATKKNWWEYVIEVIPVVGDAYGASKLGKQGYSLYKGLEKFKQVARIGAKAGESAWKKLDSMESLTGKGSQKLKDLIQKLNTTHGKKLNDNTLGGAVKEKFGLHSGFKADGTPFNHFSSAKNHLRGLEKKIKYLDQQLSLNRFQGEAGKAAKGLYKELKKRHKAMSRVLKEADKAAKKVGKIK